MVHAEALDLVQRNKHSGEKELVLLLQWQCEPVDDGTENLEEFGNAIEPLGLVDKLEEDVVDGAPNVGSKVQKFPVDAVKRSLEEVAFSGIL